MSLKDENKNPIDNHAVNQASDESDSDTGSNDEPGEAHESHQQRGAALVIESRGWYKDKFRQVVTICMILAAAVALSFVANVVQVVSRPGPVYFAVTDDLRIKQMSPMDEPNISESALLNWTSRTITETFALDFVHWRDQLMKVKPEYTEDCFKQLIGSLQDAGNLQMIKDRRLVLSAVVKNSPVVTAKGVVDGRMTWKMEFPISFSYESSERVVATQDLLCTVMARRVSVHDHPRGIQLAQMVLK